MADIDLTPTEEMAANAKRGLELRRKHGRGGTAVGVARARDISNRKTLSPETVRRMHAFFSRHEKNKAGGEDDAGYIAWMLWSGDAGQGWAKRKVEQMDKSENQRSETYKAIAERLGSAATNDRPGAKARFAQPPFSASDLNALKRLVKQYEQQAKTSKGKQGPNGENLEFKALSIAGWMQEMINYAQAGQTHRAYSIVRTSNPDYVRVLPPSLVKAAWDVTKMSRPGAKARMGANEDRKRAAGYKWQVRYTKQLGKTDYLGGSPQVIEDTVYFATESAARDWANTMLGKGWFKGMGGSPEKVLTAKVLMFSRPGAKAKFDEHWRPNYEQRAADRINTAQSLISKCEDKQREIAKTIVDLKKAINEMMNAVRRKDSNLLYDTEDKISNLDRVRSSFSRPGAKAAMAKPVVGETYVIVVRNEDEYGSRSFTGRAKAVRTIGNTYRVLLEDASTDGGNTVHRVDIDEADIYSIRKFSRPGAKVTNAVREGSKISAEDEACLKVMSAADAKVSDKIRTLITEGKPQKQAVAIALDLKRRGEL